MTPFLDRLDPETRDAVMSRLTRRRFHEGEHVVAYQAADRDLYFILKGSARVIIYSASGRIVDYRNLGAGDMFGEVALIDGGGRSASVVADTICEVGRLSPDEVWALIEELPGLNRAMLVRLAELVRMLTERVLEFSSLPGPQRIYREILRMCEESGIKQNRAEIYPAPTHQALADRVSSHREAVTRQLSALGRMGLCERRGTKLIISDVAALQQLTRDSE